MLWIDKYRPKHLSEVDYHADISEQLKNLLSEKDFPNMLFHGPSGAGKKTRILACLRELFGDGVDSMTLERKEFTTPSKAKLEIPILASNYHIELTPSDAGFQDRVVVTEVIKEIAQSGFDPTGQDRKNIIVLNEVNMLSAAAQHALRRTMELYTKRCRIFLCADSLSGIIDAIRSRCLCIRIPAPSRPELLSVLNGVAEKESLELPQQFADRIVSRSQMSTRKAILLLESSKARQYPFTVHQELVSDPWELYIEVIAREITEQQTPERVFATRMKFYELLSRCIPPEEIMKKLMKCLMNKLDDDVKMEVIEWGAFYEHRTHLGRNAIFHLEAFVAKYMGIYKNWIHHAQGLGGF